MSGHPIVSVENLSKKFSVGYRSALRSGVRDMVSEMTWWRSPSPKLDTHEFWALHNVSLQLNPGDSLGVVGGNGAGKSTLLKLMSGLLKPDTGSIRIRGRLRAIIELGGAFNPVLSGRENIYSQGTFYGYSRKEISATLDAMIDFAGVGDFIDAPLQQYSDGMRARLGFAVAIHLEPDILLVDEVLAVGDLAFQNKCLAYIRGYLARGGTLIFVGHASHQVQSACTTSLVLERGRVMFQGGVVEGLDFYFRRQQTLLGGGASVPSLEDAAVAPTISGGDTVRIVAISAKLIEPDSVADIPALRVGVEYDALAEVPAANFFYTIFSADGTRPIFAGVTSEAMPLRAGRHTVACVTRRLPLQGGRYVMRVGLIDEGTSYPIGLSGWDDTPHSFDLPSAGNVVSNLCALINLQVAAEAEWEPSAPAGAAERPSGEPLAARA